MWRVTSWTKVREPARAVFSKMNDLGMSVPVGRFRGREMAFSVKSTCSEDIKKKKNVNEACELAKMGKEA